jgi:hypothetical protein
MKRWMLIALAAILFAGLVVITASAISQRRTRTGDGAEADELVSNDRWEYLVVSGPNNNLNASGNPSLRKETSGAFGRESFVLEQSLDKLGARGWELVTVSGDPREPTYTFKRKK